MNLFYNSYSRILNTLIPVLIVANVVVYVFCFMFYVFMLLVTLVSFAKILYNKIVCQNKPCTPCIAAAALYGLLLPSRSLFLFLAHIKKFEIH